MKKLAKILSLVMVCIFTAGIFAACGTSSTPTPVADATATVATATDTAASTVVAEKQPADYKGEISVWTWWKPYFDESIADFNAAYPNVKVNLTVMGWGDYEPKFTTAKAAGSALPDVALAESYWWGKFLSYKNTFLDLSTVGFKQEDLVDSVSKVVVNEEGKFVAIPQGVGVGVIWYRKDLALKYLGTEDLNGKYATWSDLINLAGKEIKEKSGGKAFAFTNATDLIEGLYCSLKTSGKSYIDGSKLMVKENDSEAFNLLDAALKNGYVAKVNGPALDASWSKGDVVFFPSAGWREGSIPSSDKDGSGRWSVMSAPGSAYFRGGTAEMIVDNKDKDKAELAALFIKHRLFTDAGMKVNNKNGNLSAVKAIVDKKLTNGVNPFYGLDVTAFLYDILSKMPPANYGKYDNLVESEMKAAALEMEQSGLAPDKAVDKAIAAVKSKDEGIQ